MSRLSLRLKLTLAYALVMIVVLGAVGAFLYLRVGNSLQEQLDEGLLARAATLATVLRASDGLEGIELGAGGDESRVQVLDTDGSLLAGSALGDTALVTRQEIDRARGQPFFLDGRAVPGLDAPARLLVSPVQVGGEPAVLVVGASEEDRDEALGDLLAALLVGGPLALLVSSLAGYLLATAALRPVERMRRRAGEISSERPGGRLPLPAANDEIRRLGETLNAMLERLEGGLARERRFVADASHELRTPLALLRTELELALRRQRTAAELERAVRSAAEEAERLTLLADDLLVLARLDERRVPVRKEAIPAGELLETVSRRFAQRALESEREIRVVAAPETVILGDRPRLEQALCNLVDNSLRHGGGTVQLEAEGANTRVELRVGDEGEGFPTHFLPHAFERFSRADDARTRGGSGLGLAIVDAIARAHGGEARALNRAKGPLVTVVLPLDG